MAQVHDAEDVPLHYVPDAVVLDGVAIAEFRPNGDVLIR